MANELVNVLSSGKDLQPVLEDAFDKGWFEGNTNGDFRSPKETKQDYINNFKL